jgi:DNA-binding protein HU-beta
MTISRINGVARRTACASNLECFHPAHRRITVPLAEKNRLRVPEDRAKPIDSARRLGRFVYADIDHRALVGGADAFIPLLFSNHRSVHMNKGELIEAVAVEMNDSKAAATRAVDAVINCITSGIKQHDGVTIVGFGTFLKKHRKPRIGRNPVTKQPIQLPASKTVGFRPSQSLKQTV